MERLLLENHAITKLYAFSTAPQIQKVYLV